MFRVMLYIVIPIVTVLTLIINFNPKVRDKLFGGHIELAAKRMKKGFDDVNRIFCNHCGSSIEKDSKFCKSCGKEQ